MAIMRLFPYIGTVERKADHISFVGGYFERRDSPECDISISSTLGSIEDAQRALIAISCVFRERIQSQFGIRK